MVQEQRSRSRSSPTYHHFQNPLEDPWNSGLCQVRDPGPQREHTPSRGHIKDPIQPWSTPAAGAQWTPCVQEPAGDWGCYVVFKGPTGELNELTIGITLYPFKYLMVVQIYDILTRLPYFYLLFLNSFIKIQLTIVCNSVVFCMFMELFNHHQNLKTFSSLVKETPYPLLLLISPQDLPPFPGNSQST